MDSFSLGAFIDIMAQFGWGGIITIIWWVDSKRLADQQRRHQEDVAKLFLQMERNMNEMRQMYVDNVELVKDYNRVATDLHDVVVLNAQVMQQLVSDIEKNQFCPLVRKEQA